MDLKYLDCPDPQEAETTWTANKPKKIPDFLEDVNNLPGSGLECVRRDVKRIYNRLGEFFQDDRRLKRANNILMVTSGVSGAIAGSLWYYSTNIQHPSYVEKAHPTSQLMSSTLESAKKGRVRELENRFQGLKTLPNSEKEAISELIERDERIVKERNEERKAKIDPEENAAHKLKLKEAFESGSIPTLLDVYAEHERVVMAVPEEIIDAETTAIKNYGDKLQQLKAKVDFVDILKKIAEAMFKDEDREVETTNTSVFIYLASLGAKKKDAKVKGSCRVRAKATAALLQYVFPELKHDVFYLKDLDHTYPVIRKDGKMYGLNNGKVITVSSREQNGTFLFSPYRSIKRYAEMRVPLLQHNTKWQLSREEQQLGEALYVGGNLKIGKETHKLEPGKPIPAVIEDDGLKDDFPVLPLRSKRRDPRGVYPDLDNHLSGRNADQIDDDVNKYVRHYREGKPMYLDFGDDIKSPHPDFPKKVAEMLEKNPRVTLVGFDDVSNYDPKILAETLKAVPDRRIAYAFRGVPESLIPAIENGNIHGDIYLYLDPNKPTGRAGRVTQILELDAMQNVNRVAIDIGMFQATADTLHKFLDVVEKNPATVSLRCFYADFNEEIMERLLAMKYGALHASMEVESNTDGETVFEISRNPKLILFIQQYELMEYAVLYPEAFDTADFGPLAISEYSIVISHDWGDVFKDSKGQFRPKWEEYCIEYLEKVDPDWHLFDALDTIPYWAGAIAAKDIAYIHMLLSVKDRLDPYYAEQLELEKEKLEKHMNPRFVELIRKRADRFMVRVKRGERKQREMQKD